MSDFDLRKEEYSTLRKEMDTQMAELALIERNCILAVAAVYVWLVGGGAGSSLAKAGWYIPVLFAVFGGLRSLSVGLHIFTVGKYIYLVESAYLTDPALPRGWEHFLAAPEQRRRIRTGITVLFWLSFLGVTVSVAAFYGR